MVKPASRSSERLFYRVGLGILALVAVWIVVQMVLGWIFSLIRVALLLALLGIVAWFVLIGPPWMDDD
jgi:hypothetical protein